MFPSFGLSISLLVLAYLLGSFPTGYLLGRWLRGIDIRQHGSGSTGATNVLRTLGKGPGLVVLLVDALKGAIAVGFMKSFLLWGPVDTVVFSPNLQSWLIVLAGIIAVVGHSRSIFLQFQGGKSVATSLGVLLMISYPVALATLATFGLVLATSRIVSLSSISGAIAVNLFMWLWQGEPAYLVLSAIIGIYVIVRHRSNIQRILNGQEPRIGRKLPQSPA